MRRFLPWAVVGVLAIIGVALCWGIAGTHVITLTEAQVQEKIDAQLGREFPIKGATGLVVKSVVIDKALMHIADGRVSVEASINGELLLGKKFSVMVSAVGIPSYQNGAFYFKPSEVTTRDFAYQGVSPGEAIRDFADKHITNEGLNAFVKDNAQKVGDWVSDLAEGVAVHVLDKRPVYELKDDIKGFVISAALEKVEVVDDRIVVTFSLLQLALHAFIGLALAVLAVLLAIGLFLNPELMIPILFLGLISN